MSRHFDAAAGLCEQPEPETDGFKLNHTMLRIKDPQRSLDFYTRVLGMRLVRRLDFEEMRFTLYFLAFLDERQAAEVPTEDGPRTTWNFGREGVLELTHNWGDENDPEVAFHDGNSDPKGFGHIAISVPDVYRACERFEALHVDFVKRPSEGRMQGIAFIRDPDGYWIEVVQPDLLEQQGIG